MGSFLIAVIIFCGLWALAKRLTSQQSTPPTAQDPIADWGVDLPDPLKGLGEVDGRHFTAYAEQVKNAYRAGDPDEALGLILRLLGAVEAESEARAPYPVPPFYYERAAMIYRKLKLYDQELAVLMRYFKACGRAGDPPIPALVKRHAKAIELKHLADRKAQ